MNYKKTWLIIFLGLLVYFPIFFNGFVWDDEVMFQKNGESAGTYFRPVIEVIYMTIYNIFGVNPFFFHFFQLIFHIFTAILIYYLFRYFFKEVVALVLAILFLVHPMAVEAVSFASAMQEVLFTMTGLIGLLLFINLENNLYWIGGTLLLFIALLMKETAIVFFPLAFCYLIIFRKSEKKIIINYSILSTLLLFGYFIFRILNGSNYVQGPGLFPIMRVPLAVRLINIPSIISYYLIKFFYPMNLAIAQHWVIKTINFKDFIFPLILEISLLLYSAFYVIKKKNIVFGFFLLWFLIGLLPHLQIIPLNMTVAERWLYFPMIGLLGMIGAILSSPSSTPIGGGNDVLLLIITLIIIIIFSVRSFIRVLNWRSGLILFSHDIKKESSFDLQNNMGVELFRVGRYEEAKKYFEKSVKLAPYWWVNWNNLGASYEREKNYQKATEYYQRSVDNGQYYLAYENLSRMLVLYGKNRKKTEEFIKTALKIYPKNQNLLQTYIYFRNKYQNTTY